jgi:putative ABC transport system substrate-binding protein
VDDAERLWQHPWLRLALLIREPTGTRWGVTYDTAQPMVGRRHFVVAALVTLARPVLALAEPVTVRRVGILASSAAQSSATSITAFRSELERLGWRDGQNLRVEARYADEQYDRLPALAAELVRLKVEVIFAQATPGIQAAKRATTTIPIVFETLGDAVGTGLVSNLARPGGNVTGVSGFAPELNGKRLELIRELLPRARRIALVANRTNPATRVVLGRAAAAAEATGVVVSVIDVPSPAALDGAFEAMLQQRSEAFVVVADPMLFGQRHRIVELAERHRLPAIYEYRLFAELGGLLSYGPDPYDRYRRAAIYVDRILRGAQAGELPVEQPTMFELVINMKTAKALGLTIPPSLLLRADQVIE